MKNGKLRELLVPGLGKKITSQVAKEVVKDEKLFLELLTIIEEGKKTPAMKAAWILSTATVMDASHATKHAKQILHLLKSSTVSGVQREFLRAFAQVKRLPEDVHGELIGLCFRFLSDTEPPVAVKYFSIYVIEEAIKIYPDLKKELIDTLEPQLEVYNEAWYRYNKRRIDKLRRE